MSLSDVSQQTEFRGIRIRITSSYCICIILLCTSPMLLARGFVLAHAVSLFSASECIVSGKKDLQAVELFSSSRCGLAAGVKLAAQGFMKQSCVAFAPAGGVAH